MIRLGFHTIMISLLLIALSGCHEELRPQPISNPGIATSQSQSSSATAEASDNQAAKVQVTESQPAGSEQAASEKILRFNLRIAVGKNQDQLFRSTQEKPFLAIFGYLDCPPCVQAWTWANSLPGARVFAIGVESETEKLEALQEMWRQQKLGYPLLLDRYEIAFRKLGVAKVPAFVLVDSEDRLSLLKQGLNEEIQKEVLSQAQKIGVVPTTP